MSCTPSPRLKYPNPSHPPPIRFASLEQVDEWFGLAFRGDQERAFRFVSDDDACQCIWKNLSDDWRYVRGTETALYRYLVEAGEPDTMAYGITGRWAQQETIKRVGRARRDLTVAEREAAPYQEALATAQAEMEDAMRDMLFLRRRNESTDERILRLIDQTREAERAADNAKLAAERTQREAQDDLRLARQAEEVARMAGQRE